MNITLAILAAGLGSRFGSDKQLEHIHADNILLDYSIHDAIEAGFTDVVLIIRTEIEQMVKDHLKGKFEGVKITLVFQDKHNPKVEGRTKPWGTGHAMLCLKEVVKNPFLIINADDHYGKEVFVEMAKALKSGKEKTLYSAGYKLKNTLSENGTVSRGICKVDENNILTQITEITKLKKHSENEAIDEETNLIFPLDSFVSMNFWGFQAEILDTLQPLFNDFVEKNRENLKAEFYIGAAIEKMQSLGYKVLILPTDSEWFGMTYREDLAMVKNEIERLISENKYPSKI